MFKYLSILLITLSFFSCDSDNTPVITPPVTDTKPVWPQVGYNGRHTGNRYGINVNIPPVQTGNIYWRDTLSTGYVYDGSEACCDALGNFYFLSTTQPFGKVIKYRPDGSKIWMRDSLYLDAYFGIALSHDETRIYYSDFAKFSCRDSSGNLLWSIPQFHSWGVIPCIAKDGTIYTSLGYTFSAISPQGNIKWQITESDVGTCWPVLDRYDNVWVRNKLSTGFYELLKIDKDGSISARYNLSNYIYSVVIDGLDNIYFRDETDLTSLDKNGVKRWVRKCSNTLAYVPAVTNDNLIIIDSLFTSLLIAVDTGGNTVWKSEIPGLRNVEPYIALDNDDNIYFNYWNNNLGFSICSVNKYGTIRWQNINPVIGLVLPGLTLSPLGMLFDTPKRPNVVFTIK